MGIVGVPMLMGPVLGPVLGGAIVEHASWRWIFLVNLPIGAVALRVASRTLEEDEEPRARVPLDVRGLVVLSPGFALLTYGLAELSRRGWHPDVRCGSTSTRSCWTRRRRCASRCRRRGSPHSSCD